MAGGVRLRSKGSQVVPVLGDLAVFIKAENIEGHLLTGTGEVVDGLEEHIVPVLKSTDVVHRGFHIGGCEIFHGTDKSVRAGAVEHLRAAQCAVIRALSAALREKRRLIQRDDIAVFPLHAGFDHGGKVQHIHIFVV